MHELEQKLAQVESAISTFTAKQAEEVKNLGTAQAETKQTLADLQKQFDALVLEMKKPVNPASGEQTFEQSVKENESVQRVLRDKTGRALIHISPKHFYDLFERKTTITSTAVGVATSGVLQIDRTPGIVEEARMAPTVRSLLSSRPTSMQVVDYVKVNASMVNGSPQTEASAKFENAVTFNTASQTVQTIATWIPATKQILDDFGELMAFLNTSLVHYVNMEEEEQLLSGDNTGQNLNGLITQGQAFDTGLLNATAGWTRIDVLGRVVQQIMADKEVAPTWAVVHPNDYWSIRLTKDSYGRYLLGDPTSPYPASIFGLRLVPTTSITSGNFLVGNGSPVCAEIRDRAGMTVEISTEHSTYFTQNMVAIRAEKRLALVVYRPNAFCDGTFTTSPSS